MKLCCSFGELEVASGYLKNANNPKRKTTVDLIKEDALNNEDDFKHENRLQNIDIFKNEGHILGMF